MPPAIPTPAPRRPPHPQPPPARARGRRAGAAARPRGPVPGRNPAGHPDARLVAVADPHAPSAQELAAATGAEVALLDEIGERSEVDAIAVWPPSTSPPDL